MGVNVSLDVKMLAHGATRGSFPKVRARAKITSHFCIPSSGHLRPRLNRKILEIVWLFLWVCLIGAVKSNLNLGANSGNLFLRGPLEQALKYSLSKICPNCKSQYLFMPVLAYSNICLINALPLM